MGRYSQNVFRLATVGRDRLAPTRDIFAAVSLHVFLQIVINTLACNQKRNSYTLGAGRDLQGEKFICKRMAGITSPFVYKIDWFWLMCSIFLRFPSDFGTEL